jgi:hypothetical protein
MLSAGQPILRGAFSWLLALAAALYSVYMCIQTSRQLLAVFSLADPTGLSGLSFNGLGLLANAGVVFLFLILLRRGIRAPVPVLCTVIFGLKVFEAAGALPCLWVRPGELCGVASVLISYATAPLTVVLMAMLVLRAGRANIRLAGLLVIAVLTVVAAAGAVAWWRITPKNAGGCTQIAEVSGRGVCLEKFALRDRDMDVCRRIEFRPVRHECMSLLAQATRRPELCQEIRDAPGTQVPAYETPDSDARSLCYYSLAFELKSRDLCLNVETAGLRQTCLRFFPDTGK